jgi:hypothetical protein
MQKLQFAQNPSQLRQYSKSYCGAGQSSAGLQWEVKRDDFTQALDFHRSCNTCFSVQGKPHYQHRNVVEGCLNSTCCTFVGTTSVPILPCGLEFDDVAACNLALQHGSGILITTMSALNK